MNVHVAIVSGFSLYVVPGTAEHRFAVRTGGVNRRRTNHIPCFINMKADQPLKISVLLALWFAVSAGAAEPADTSNAGQIWKDPAQPTAARVQDLVSRMTLAEKVSQLGADPVAIPRLGMPAYSHRNECLHGVMGSTATVFPQAIGMAATWDTPLIRQEADAISTEARAKWVFTRHSLMFVTQNLASA